MSFGGQSVTLRASANTDTRDRLNQREKADTDVTVAGVLMRPVRQPTEQVALTDVSTQLWRCTAPPVDATLNATALGVLFYDGTPTPATVDANAYQIVGVEPFPDLSGAIEHVRITCQKQLT